MSTILIATLGDFPVVVTAMYDSLVHKKNIAIDKVMVLHSRDRSVKQGYTFIKEMLQTKGCETASVELPFEDANSEQRSLEFLQILAKRLDTAQKAGDTVYLSLAGGRKNTSAIMALLVPLFDCVKGLYHLNDPDEYTDDSHFKSNALLNRLSKEQRLKHLFPPIGELEPVEIPYDKRKVKPEFLKRLWTLTEADIDKLWQDNPVMAEKFDFARKVVVQPSARIKVLLTSGAAEQYKHWQQSDACIADRFAECFRQVSNGEQLKASFSEGPFYKRKNPLPTFYLYKKPGSSERLLYCTEPQMSGKSSLEDIEKIIIVGLAIEEPDGIYTPDTDVLRQAYDPAAMVSLEDILRPAQHASDETRESILVIPLGTTPMIATQIYQLFKDAGRKIREVILVYPNGSEQVRSSAKYAIAAFEKDAKDVVCTPVTVPVCDLDRTEDYEQYEKKLEDTIKERQDRPHKCSIEMALSGGRKGMAALAMFVAQRRGIRYLYHTLIEDDTLEEQVTRETSIKALERLSDKERSNRLFLRKHKEQGAKFSLFPVPVLPLFGIIELFIFYAHKDEKFVEPLRKHLSLLKRQELIWIWHEKDIVPGTDWMRAIKRHMRSADIILLLLSADFFDDDTYDTGITLAMDRAKRGEAHVIPVIVRACEWEDSLFGTLQALPRNKKPIKREGNDDAFNNIASEIRRLCEELQKPSSASSDK